MRNLLPHFIADEYLSGNRGGAFQACTLFVDVSGFTPMTEALMQHGSEGAEVVSQLLNTVFESMVDAVYRNGGFISNFPGDAFTAMFPVAGSSLPVLLAAERIRSIFTRHGGQKTKFGEFDLAVRTGISIGEVEWRIVGAERHAYFFRGEALDSCAAGKRRAARGQIILDEAIMRTIDSGQVEAESAGGGFHTLKRVADREITDPSEPVKRRPLHKDVALKFLPPEVVDFHHTGEFRDVASVFLSFEGISESERMNSFASAILDRAHQFSGYVKEIEFTEGGVVPCFFGAPVAFENNIERALEFIISLRSDVAKQPELSALRMRAGITHGRVFAGMIGGHQRSQYALIGSMVNLAARISALSSWDEIRVSERVAAQRGFRFIEKGSIRYKGIARPVSTFALIDRAASDSGWFLTPAMIGRTAEMRMLRGFVEPIFEGAFAGIAYVYGDPGIGKSQLAHAFRDALTSEQEVSWFICQCDEVLRKPFNPFISFLRGYFSQAVDAETNENKAAFDKRFDRLIDGVMNHSQIGTASKREEVVRELKRTRSILGALVGLSWDYSLYETLDAKGRYENTIHALKALFIAESLLCPIVIQIEDGHWLDSDSASLVTALTRTSSAPPLMLLVTSRYSDDGTLPRIQLEDIPEISLRVNNLSAADLASLAEAELGGKPSPQLQDVLLEKTRGNPFFTQQMLLYFKEHGMLMEEEDGWKVKQQSLDESVLPETVGAMLIARIDRLSQRVKEVVKAAAVIGQEFETVLLSAVLKNDVTAEVRDGEQCRIWGMIDELHYIFRHALLRDAAYTMQLWARLRELHRLTAEAMETMYADSIDEHAADIAHHYEKAEIVEKAIRYLEKAGDHARAQYQNQKAIELYDRMLVHIGESEDMRVSRGSILSKTGDILELIGQWSEAEDRYRRALAIAEEADDAAAVANAQCALGRLLVQQGKDSEAMSFLQSALSICETLGDRPGAGRAIGSIGLVSRNQGDYPGAMESYRRQLSICEETGDWHGAADVLSNIGIAYEDLGDYVNAMDAYRKHLSISQEHGDRRGIARAIGNIGVAYFYMNDYPSAMEAYRQHLSLSEELGYRRGVAIAVGNIGLLYSEQKDYLQAMEYSNRDLAICEELGDRRGVSDAIGNIGELYGLLEDSDNALKAFRRKLEISRELGDKGDIALALGCIGGVHYRLEDYEQALECYEAAIIGFREVGTRYYSTPSLHGKASLLVDLTDSEGPMPDYLPRFVPDIVADSWHDAVLKTAEELAGECAAIASELSKEKALFDAMILLQRIKARRGDRAEALQGLEEMLKEENSDEHRAMLHYRLWKISGAGHHRLEALRLYEQLSAATPRKEYEKWIEELS